MTVSAECCASFACRPLRSVTGGLALGELLEVGSREAVRETDAAGFGIGVVSESNFGNDRRLVPLRIEGEELAMTEDDLLVQSSFWYGHTWAQPRAHRGKPGPSDHRMLSKNNRRAASLGFLRLLANSFSNKALAKRACVEV